MLNVNVLPAQRGDALQYLEDLPDGVTFGDIWFNGWDQMKAIGLEPMGVKEGIRLSELLKKNHKAWECQAWKRWGLLTSPS